MVLWLQRQESTILFDSFLQWAASNCIPIESDAASDTHQDIMSTAAPNNDLIDDRAAIQYGSACCHLPKLPSRLGVSTEDIISEFGATHFVSTLENFVASSTGLHSLKSRNSDLYDVYSQFKVSFPDCNLPGSCLPSQSLVEHIHAHLGISSPSSQ
jgi:hypothetical protein